jgi:hypothetical protein
MRECCKGGGGLITAARRGSARRAWLWRRARLRALRDGQAAARKASTPFTQVTPLCPEGDPFSAPAALVAAAQQAYSTPLSYTQHTLQTMCCNTTTNTRRGSITKSPRGEGPQRMALPAQSAPTRRRPGLCRARPDSRPPAPTLRRRARRGNTNTQCNPCTQAGGPARQRPRSHLPPSFLCAARAARPGRSPAPHHHHAPLAPALAAGRAPRRSASPTPPFTTSQPGGRPA